MKDNVGELKCPRTCKLLEQASHSLGNFQYSCPKVPLQRLLDGLHIGFLSVEQGGVMFRAWNYNASLKLSI